MAAGAKRSAVIALQPSKKRAAPAGGPGTLPAGAGLTIDGRTGSDGARRRFAIGLSNPIA